MAIGWVAGAWGLRGEVRVEPLAPLSQFGPGLPLLAGGKPTSIEGSRPAGRYLRVKLAGVLSRREAEELRGQYLQAREEDLLPLPPGHYYRYQLVGLAVRASDGRDLGRIVDVLSTAESDVFVLRGSLGEVLIPATEEIVTSVDLPARLVTVEVVPGLLEEGGAAE